VPSACSRPIDPRPPHSLALARPPLWLDISASSLPPAPDLPVLRPRTMAQKLTDEELLAQFDNLGTDEPSASASASAPAPVKPAARASKPPQPTSRDDEDPLAELEDLAKAAAQRPSRPDTPKLSSSSTTSKRGVVTPSSTGSARTSEEKPHPPAIARKSADSTRSFRQPQYAEDTVEAEKPAAAQGSWWGGFLSTASAAVSQAQAAVKEIQKNEEAQKWAERVRANAGALRGLGELRRLNYLCLLHCAVHHSLSKLHQLYKSMVPDTAPCCTAK
jgi:hypothetical protein